MMPRKRTVCAWICGVGQVHEPRLLDVNRVDEGLQAAHLTLVARAEYRRNQLLDHPAPSRYSPRAAMKSATASGTQ